MTSPGTSCDAVSGDERRELAAAACPPSFDARLILLVGTCIGDDVRAPSRIRHAQASTRHTENGSDGFDQPLAPPRGVYLGEAFQGKFEPDKVVRAEQWGDRQLREFWGANNQPREMLLNIAGNSRFDRRIHLEE